MTDQFIPARPTVYKGIKMRSRLEAAFAAWRDSENWPWEYEPECFANEVEQYLPDFYYKALFSDVYVEVKPPVADMREALRRMHVIHASNPAAILEVCTSQDYKNFNVVASCSPHSPCPPCAYRRIDQLESYLRSQEQAYCRLLTEMNSTEIALYDVRDELEKVTRQLDEVTEAYSQAEAALARYASKPYVYEEGL